MPNEIFSKAGDKNKLDHFSSACQNIDQRKIFDRLKLKSLKNRLDYFRPITKNKERIAFRFVYIMILMFEKLFIKL